MSEEVWRDLFDIEMCDEKWILIHHMLNDENEFLRVLDMVVDPCKHHLQQEIFHEFQTLENFANIVDRWVRIQTQPFLSIKIIEEMSSIKNEHQIQNGYTKNAEENIQFSSNRLIPKKKVSTMTISASLPSNFGQSSPPVQLRVSPQKEIPPSTQNQWPSLSESNISQPKQAKPQSKKKRITPTLVSPQDQSQKPLQEVPVTSNLPSPPVPTLVHQMSTTMKSHFDHLGIVVEVHDSKKDPQDSFENSVSHMLTRDEHSLDDERPTITLARLARLYAALVKSKLIPIIPTVLFLSRLLSSRHTCVVIGKEITVSTGASPKFPCYFLNDFSLSFFLAEVSLNLSDIIQSLGDQFCSSYAELVLDVSPLVSQSLLARSRRSSSFTQEEYSELYPFMGQEHTSSVDREEYIRPFHDERDNRHEYRGKVSMR